jgi:cytochrome c biogenesis protein CcmG/thiol:disulfide interchange protein DsbE
MGRSEKRIARPLKSARRRTAARCLIFLAAVLLSLLAAAMSATHAAENGFPAIGVAAVDFELKTLDGQILRLETFRGKPLLINFFASWCDPCRDEMPLLNELASKSSRTGYSLLGVAVQDSRAALAEFAREAGIVFPIALDLNSKVQRAYRIFGPPATFVIDGQGVLRDIILGPMTPERAREALAKVGVSGEVKK